jgi:hypothetical protein
MSQDTTDNGLLVSEDKFNGTATLTVTVPDGTSKDRVEAAARKYFHDTHGTRPSRVVASKADKLSFDGAEDTWDVMVADHSSGSLCDSESYEL